MDDPTAGSHRTRRSSGRNASLEQRREPEPAGFGILRMDVKGRFAGPQGLGRPAGQEQHKTSLGMVTRQLRTARRAVPDGLVKVEQGRSEDGLVRLGSLEVPEAARPPERGLIRFDRNGAVESFQSQVELILTPVTCASVT